MNESDVLQMAAEIDSAMEDATSAIEKIANRFDQIDDRAWFYGQLARIFGKVQALLLEKQK